MKERLDVAIFEKGLCESREKARAFILAGEVTVNGSVADKCGYQIKPDDIIELKGPALKYVSRGGLKLEKAIEVFDIKADGFTAMDIGASTGGFTDCLLQNGAKKVYSIDVGYGQLAYKLRCNERVVVIEKCNFRYIERDTVNEKLDIIVCDVSFISLTKIAAKIKEFADDDCIIVLLIKPQFEAEKSDIGKNGVIRDKTKHFEIVKKVTAELSEAGLYLKGLDYSPIKGPKGNIEFIALFGTDEVSKDTFGSDMINRCIENAHTELDK